MTISEQLLHATVRITSTLANGATKYGTGFFYSFFEHNGRNVLAVVTNKHVISGAKSGYLRFSQKKSDGTADLAKFIDFNLDKFEQSWILHPDNNVDLAIMYIGAALELVMKTGFIPYINAVNADLIPTDEDMSVIKPLEDVLIVGYPNSIIDEKHNIPIFRKGITATPAYIDFNGKSEFLIDASIFPGSSGSPVFLYSEYSWAPRGGGITIGSGKCMLLGVVYAVHQFEINGSISIVPAPTQTRAITTQQIPINLGICVKSSRILDFEPLMAKKHFIVPDGYKMRSTLKV